MDKFWGPIGVLFSLLTGAVFSLNASEVYRNGIIVEVEGQVITQQQVELEARIFNRGVPAQEESRKLALQAIIERAIITKEFNRMHAQLPSNYVQKKYDQILAVNFFGDRIEFQKALRQHGKTARSYKKEIEDNAVVEFMYERNVAMPTVVSPLDIRGYYNAHQPEIFVEKKVDFDQAIVTDKSEESIQKIQDCIAQVLPYDDICNALNDIPGVMMSRMENVSFKDILPEIAQQVESMSVGSFREILLGEARDVIFFGLRKVQEARPLSLAEASRKIEQILLNEKYDQLRNQWLDGLKSKAYCVTF